MLVRIDEARGDHRPRQRRAAAPLWLLGGLAFLLGTFVSTHGSAVIPQLAAALHGAPSNAHGVALHAVVAPNLVNDQDLVVMKPRTVRSAVAPHAASLPAQLRRAAAPTRLEASLQYGPPIHEAEDCSRLLVYNMQPLAPFGFGSQLANYLLAFAAAQQLNRSLVVAGKYTLGCDTEKAHAAGTLTTCLLQATSTCKAPTPAVLDLARCYNRKRPRGAAGQQVCDVVQRRADSTTVLRCDVDDDLLRAKDSACNPKGDAVKIVNILVAHANWARGFAYAHWAAFEELLLRGTAPGDVMRVGGVLCTQFSCECVFYLPLLTRILVTCC